MNIGIYFNNFCCYLDTQILMNKRKEGAGETRCPNFCVLIFNCCITLLSLMFPQVSMYLEIKHLDARKLVEPGRGDGRRGTGAVVG